MAEALTGDRVHLVNEGSVFTDAGTLVAHGEPGIILGHRGLSEVVVDWHGMGAYGVAPVASLAITPRVPKRSTR